MPVCCMQDTTLLKYINFTQLNKYLISWRLKYILKMVIFFFFRGKSGKMNQFMNNVKAVRNVKFKTWM